MTVIACVSIMLSLLLPAVTAARNAAYRVIGAANQRTLGQGLFMFSGGRDGRLPPSRVLVEDPLELAELMRVYQPMTPNDWADLHGKRRNRHRKGAQTPGDRYRTFWAIDSANFGWDGLGHLFYGNFVGEPGVYYSPSHRGEHEFERYEDDWVHPDSGRMPPTFTIYSNFHYIGHMNADGSEIRLEHSSKRIIVTDGLRTQADLTQHNGMNTLWADGSVHWMSCLGLFDVLPANTRNTSDTSRQRQNDLIRSIFDGYLGKELRRLLPDFGV
jgi:prepilin-type processing-associated H-X9-DG protein